MLTILGATIFPGIKKGDSFFIHTSGFTDVDFCTILTYFISKLLGKNH
jgi:hypothetical protein